MKRFKEKNIKNNKSKYRKYIFISFTLFLLLFSLFVFCITFFVKREFTDINISQVPSVKEVLVTDDNKLLVKFKMDLFARDKNVFCMFNMTGDVPLVDDSNWILTSNNECSISMDNNIYYGFLKNNNGDIVSVSDTSKIGKVLNLKSNKNKIYLALKGKYKLNLTYDKIGYVEDVITWKSENESVAKVDEDGLVLGVSKGETKIIGSINNQDVSIDVIVSDLIVVRPKVYDRNKSSLPCGKHSEKDNDLLDEILVDRVNDVGRKTRAGVVETARFLALEFPYKIRYFSENGRLTGNGVDGEGRYYHEGLYLHKSRYENIDKSMRGPKTWGCSLWSNPSKAYRQNGLDCSGFMTWVFLNGGFDTGDIGAGVSGGILDFTDLGEKTRFTDEIKKSGKIKVGDLLSSGGSQGGHIALIVGEDNEFYYVAESLWTPPNTAVVIIAYPKTKEIKKKYNTSYEVINDRYYWVMLMDSYYKKDGNLTNMW